MDRKDFLQTSIPFVASLSLIRKTEDPDDETAVFPKYLKPAGTIGITCPSGHISLEECEPAIRKMKEWGFEVKIGKTVGLRDFTFAGTDDERAADFQQMIDDDSVDAIMFGRGGYGAIRILDRIDFSKFRKKPKWIIGFSDATAIHVLLNGKYKIPSIHSKMCNSFLEDESKGSLEQLDSIDSIRRCLLGNEMKYACTTGLQNRPGTAKGKLVGGNLSLLQMMSGSKTDVKTDGKILFIEDVGEYLYKLDGMMWNLLRAGKLDKLKGLIIGGFRIKPDDEGEEFGLSLYDIVMEKVKQFDYPVCFDFPVGHIKVNYALKCGVEHKLSVYDHSAELVSLR
ncbi:MAG: LD-carboxypeptidase [Chitinophagaceae bacterium]|nr:LD-carboxypeptidase [Chitinophagaceae bacterium]